MMTVKHRLIVTNSKEYAMIEPTSNENQLFWWKLNWKQQQY